jgi:hypothetical protein
MRTIITMFILGFALGFQGCTQKEEASDDDREIVIKDNAETVYEEEPKEEDEKHMDDPADILQDLTF